MNWEGNLRKMAVKWGSSAKNEVQYRWVGADILESMPPMIRIFGLAKSLHLNLRVSFTV